MFDVGNKGTDKLEVFYVLFDKEPIVYIETYTVCVLLEKEFPVLIEVFDRIYF